MLPGVGPLATIAMLLPITFGLPPVGALIMLAGIYYGAQYGGSTTSILINIPGESSSVVTTLDGHQMARQGRAGPALAIAAIGSFFAGCVVDRARRGARRAADLDRAAVRPGRIFLADGARPVLRGRARPRLDPQGARHGDARALLLSMVGSDIETGQSRMAFDIPELSDGIGFVVVAMGVFGFAEIMRNLEQPRIPRRAQGEADRPDADLAGPQGRAGAIGRGTVLGAILGILPGGGAVIAAFAAYTFEKKMAKDPSRFGRGAIEGVAAPESANNAAAQTSFIPLLTLGIPPNAVMALMVGAMTIHGIVPGPAGDDQAAGPVLGHDRLDVARQPDAGRHQPAAGRRVGAAAAGALPPAVPGDPDLLLHRRLFDQQRAVRRGDDRRVRLSSATGWSSTTSSRRRCCSASCSDR